MFDLLQDHPQQGPGPARSTSTSFAPTVHNARLHAQQFQSFGMFHICTEYCIPSLYSSTVIVFARSSEQAPQFV
jgi:hypothetical protein